jgi:hypothetical protein
MYIKIILSFCFFNIIFIKSINKKNNVSFALSENNKDYIHNFFNNPTLLKASKINTEISTYKKIIIQNPNIFNHI